MHAVPLPSEIDQSLAAGRSAAADAHWPALMRAAQSGDAAAYMRLLREIVPLVRHILRGRAPPNQVEDIVQDVLLTLHRVRHSYDPARPFIPWLAAITQRRAIDAQRRRGRVQAHESAGDALDNLPPPTSAQPESLYPGDAIDAASRAGWLREAVSALPRRQRAAVELVKLNELSIAEAAAQTGQTPNAVKVNVHRGMQALRRLLRAEPA